jgi:nucleotide-binding universal stress UspA family protein
MKMKTILIATDFSGASRNASIYGIRLAKVLKAKVILFSAFRLPPHNPYLDMSMARYAIMMQTDKRLLHEADFLDPQRTTVDIICDEGVAVDAIMNMANEKKVDFIIIGMQNTGKGFKKVVSRTGISLSRNSNIPVIMIPEDVVFRSLDSLGYVPLIMLPDISSERQVSNKKVLEKRNICVYNKQSNDYQQEFSIY